MRREHHFLPLRSAVVFAHSRRMLDSTAMCVRKFSTAIAEQYMALVAPDLRTVPFRWGVSLDELIKAEKHNAQIVGRYMDGTVKVLPVDLEDAWLLALPEPFRSDCERELAGRRGRMSFEIPSLDASEADAIAPVLTEAGELFGKWGRAMADSSLSIAELLDVQAEADDVIAAVLRFKQYATARASVSKGGGRG